MPLGEGAVQISCAKPASELLAGSQEAAQHVQKSQLQELKALSKPPTEVFTVVSCLFHLFTGMDEEMKTVPSRLPRRVSWKDCKKMLANPSKLLDRISNFPDAIAAGEVPRRNIEKARRIQISMGYAFSKDAMCQKSQAAASICSWLMNIIALYDVTSPLCRQRTMKEAVETDLGVEDMASPAGVIIEKADIQELKSFGRPPREVMVVCVCVCHLRPLGNEEGDAGWAGAKAMLADASLLKALQEFKVENVREEQIARVRELMSQEKQIFENDAMKEVSKAAFGLVRWVRAVIERYDANIKSINE